MRFIKTELEKKARNPRKDLMKELKAFMSMNVKTAKVVYTKGEYACATAASGALRTCIRTYGLPINVKMRNGNVYLIRTDL